MALIRLDTLRHSCQTASLQAIARLMNSVVEHRDTVLARIETARKRAVKPAASTTLIAVSKYHPVEAIRPLLEAGHRHFGENRVQESLAKWPALKAEFPDILLHLIGPLQSNKVPEAVGLFDAIHSVDRPKLLHALQAECDKTGRQPDLFVQVNTGAEHQKAGVLPAEAPAFIADVKTAFGNQLKGLMCIPPNEEAPAPHFAFLQKLAEGAALTGLSMGMSSDYEIAVRFGASYVRVGTGIFGPRDYGTSAA